MTNNESNRVLADWLGQRCLIGAPAKAPWVDIHADIVSWCRAVRAGVPSGKQINLALSAAGMVRHADSRRTWWIGLRLRGVQTPPVPAMAVAS
jgi:hypothetical protein